MLYIICYILYIIYDCWATQGKCRLIKSELCKYSCRSILLAAWHDVIELHICPSKIYPFSHLWLSAYSLFSNSLHTLVSTTKRYCLDIICGDDKIRYGGSSASLWLVLVMRPWAQMIVRATSNPPFITRQVDRIRYTCLFIKIHPFLLVSLGIFLDQLTLFISSNQFSTKWHGKCES